MLKFFSDALQELSRVSWPTKKDMERYMIASGIVIAFGVIFIMFWGSIFAEGLTSLKSNTASSATPVTNLSDLLATGSTISGATTSPTVN